MLLNSNNNNNNVIKMHADQIYHFQSEPKSKPNHASYSFCFCFILFFSFQLIHWWEASPRSTRPTEPNMTEQPNSGQNDTPHKPTGRQWEEEEEQEEEGWGGG